MHDFYMNLAFELAEKGKFTTRPNPRVGCVLVKNNQVVGSGWHKKAGQDHAEVLALRQAGVAAKGATAYVTLEPCSHQGKTGPCALALVKAGVSRVVAAVTDPNPLVAGKGFHLLRQAGIEVITDLMPERAVSLNPGFHARMTNKKPFVRLKMASSLDGRTAMASGESQWITGPQARQQVQLLRAQSCAVITGIGTVLADDPSMNVRIDEFELRNAISEADFTQPISVILDSNLRTPLNAKILQNTPKPLIIYGASEAPLSSYQHLKKNAELLQVSNSKNGLDLSSILSLLAQRECNEILIECGPTLAGSFLKQKLVDELILFIAPTLMGSRARPLFDLPIDLMAEKLNLKIGSITPVGNDWCITAQPISKPTN